MHTHTLFACLILGLSISCGSGSTSTSSNPAVQAILNDINTVNSSSTCQVPQGFNLTPALLTQAQVNAMTNNCSASDLSALKVYTGCFIATVCGATSASAANTAASACANGLKTASFSAACEAALL